MIRLTPRSTRTDTLLPYTTRCRSQGFFSIAASTCTESVTGLSEAAWLAGEDCDDVALSPLPPQAASSSAGASTSIAYDAARGVDIGFDMENSCRWLRPGVRGGSDSKSADVNSWKRPRRSEEHTSELQSLMRLSYAVFCLKKNTTSS